MLLGKMLRDDAEIQVIRVCVYRSSKRATGPRRRQIWHAGSQGAPVQTIADSVHLRTLVEASLHLSVVSSHNTQQGAENATRATAFAATLNYIANE